MEQAEKHTCAARHPGTASPVTACEIATGAKQAASGLPRVVVVGAGFGGLAVAKELAKAPATVTVIDRHNYHLFQPLLYQVATAALSPADIAWPIRHILKDQKNTSVLLDLVKSVDKKRQVVRTEGGGEIPYDYLVIATGAQHSYFGKDEWEKNAPGLKTIADATRLRQKILLAFEKAEVEKDPEKRAALLTFIIVGAGPTGVELAGAIAELARHSITQDFRHITPQCARIMLVEAGPRVLAAFAEDLSENARKTLEKMGVEVLLNMKVENVDAESVTMNGLRVDAKTVMWAAGVKASSAGLWLEAPVDRSGRVVVNDHLNIAGDERIFVVGDTAAYTPKGEDRPLPGVAPVAKQMGRYAGRLIRAKIVNGKLPEPFRYKNPGAMATIGRGAAVAQLPHMKVTGFAGWFLWSAAHVYFLIDLRNRVAVVLSWLWQYLTWQRGVRLITDQRSMM